MLTIFAVEAMHDKFKNTTFTANWWQMQKSCFLTLENQPGAFAETTRLDFVGHFSFDNDLFAYVAG